jgi:hypothetical protein
MFQLTFMSKSDAYLVAHATYRDSMQNGVPVAALRGYRLAASMFKELGDYNDAANWAREAESDAKRAVEKLEV